MTEIDELREENRYLREQLELKDRKLSDLRKINQQINLIASNAPILVWIVDIDGIFILSEGAALSKLDIFPGELVGKSIDEVFGESPDILQHHYHALTGVEMRYLYQRKNKDANDEASDFFFESHLTPYYTDGIVGGIVGVASDITLLHYMQLNYIESDRRFQTLINSSPLGILVLRDAICEFANPSFLDMFGYDDEFQINGTPGVEFLVPSVRVEMIKRTLNRQKGGTELLSYETTGLRQDESIFPVQIIGTRIVYDSKPSVMLFFLNLSEFKQLEREKDRLHDQLLESQKFESLGMIAHSMAHDFNNLLVGIMGNASLIQLNLNPNSNSAILLSEIQRISIEAANFTKQILNYSNTSSSQDISCNLSDVVKEITKLLSLSVPKSITIKSNLGVSLYEIKGNVSQLQQLILNLVINASESIGDGNGNIEVITGNLVMDDSDVSIPEGMYSFVEVIDDGDMIDKDDINLIFDPDYNFRGMGLSIVQGITDYHNGLLDIKSDENGTSFKVLFPKLGSKSKTIDQIHTVDNGVRGYVLFCDDDPLVRDVGEKMLNYLGFDVITASDGQKALDILSYNDHNIILVVLDLTMPVLSGRETLGRIQEMMVDLPVIISSGHNSVVNEFRGRKNIKFLPKPYTLDKFRNTIAQIL